MFKRKKTYYTSYRGRGSSSSRRMLLIGVLTLVLLCIIIGFFALSEYLVFSADGFYFSFREPKEETETPKTPVKTDDQEESFNIVIDGHSIEPVTATDEQPGEQTPLLGINVDMSRVLNDGYLTDLADEALAAGCNTLCFLIKDTDGVMRIPVTSTYSSQGSEAADTAQLKAALTSLKSQREISLTARVSCLCDMLAPPAHKAGAVTVKSGQTWLDKYSRRWINAYSDMAAEYVSDIVAACAQAGFDQVILDHLCFPVEGQTDLIEYPDVDTADTRREAIRVILEAAVETAKPEGVKLSVILESATAFDVSGQDPSMLAGLCDGIFYEGAADDALEASLRDMLSDGHCLVGRINAADAFAAPSGGASFIAGRIK